MGILACHGWWIVLGLLGGTLLSWLLHLLLLRNGSNGGNDPYQKPVGSPPSNPTSQSSQTYSRQSHDDQLEAIEGIGPKIANVFRNCNIHSFADMASKTPYALRTILDEAGNEFDLARTTTWPQQAKLLADGDILAFMELTQKLKGGIDPSTK